MYIYHYKSPFAPEDGHNYEKHRYPLRSKSTSVIIHDVQLTRYRLGSEVLYELELKIFGGDNMQEEETVRDACEHIMKNADNIHQQERLMEHDQHSGVFLLSTRTYRCMTKRKSDDNMFCVMGEFPSIPNIKEPEFCEINGMNLHMLL